MNDMISSTLTFCIALCYHIQQKASMKDTTQYLHNGTHWEEFAMTWTEHIQLLHLSIDIPYIYYPPPTHTHTHTRKLSDC